MWVSPTTARGGRGRSTAWPASPASAGPRPHAGVRSGRRLLPALRGGGTDDLPIVLHRPAPRATSPRPAGRRRPAGDLPGAPPLLLQPGQAILASIVFGGVFEQFPSPSSSVRIRRDLGPAADVADGRRLGAGRWQLADSRTTEPGGRRDVCFHHPAARRAPDAQRAAGAAGDGGRRGDVGDRLRLSALGHRRPARDPGLAAAPAPRRPIAQDGAGLLRVAPGLQRMRRWPAATMSARSATSRGRSALRARRWPGRRRPDRAGLLRRADAARTRARSARHGGGTMVTSGRSSSTTATHARRRLPWHRWEFELATGEASAGDQRRGS